MIVIAEIHEKNYVFSDYNLKFMEIDHSKRKWYEK